MQELVPGWYPDPARGADTYRWWTGTSWSDQLANDPTAPPPPPGATLRTVEPVAQGRSRRGLVALAMSTALVLVILVAAASVGSARGDGRPDLPRGPVPTLPAPTAAPPWAIGPDGTMTFGDLATARFPGAPYSRATRPDTVYGFFHLGTAVSAVTQPKTGSTREWSATVASGWVDPSVVAETPQLTAVSLLSNTPEVIFSTVKTTTSTPQTEAVPGFDETVATRLTARITYSAAGVAASHDDVVIIVVRTDPVNYVAWLSSLPSDTPAAIQQLTADAEHTITRR